MQGQAQDLGANWLAVTDLSFSERYLEAVKQVTPVDLQRVARQYLTNENRTVYALLPTGTAPKPAEQLESSHEHEIQKFELANGLRLLVKEDHRLPFVEFRAVFKGGVLVETPETNVVTQLMSRTLLKGTSTRSAEEIARQIESVGGSIDSYGGNNTFGVNAEVLSGDFMIGLELMADVLCHANFPQTAFERERETQLANIRGQKDQLLQSASRAMRRGLFGDAGYGLDALGTEQNVQQLQVESLKGFYQQYTVPNNCVLAIYGDIDSGVVRAEVEKAFADWQPLPAKSNKIFHTASPRLDSVVRVTERRDKKQAVIVIGFRGLTLHDPDRYRLELLQEASQKWGPAWVK